MGRIVKAKWGTSRSDPEKSLAASFRDWNPKTDFAPALLHAENLSWMLSDAAAAEELLRQAEQHDERLPVLERFLERAEARSNDKLYRIRNTGDGLLARLRRNEELPPQRKTA